VKIERIRDIRELFTDFYRLRISAA